MCKLTTSFHAIFYYPLFVAREPTMCSCCKVLISVSPLFRYFAPLICILLHQDMSYLWGDIFVLRIGLHVMHQFLHLSVTYFYQLCIPSAFVFEGNQVISLSDCLSHPYSRTIQPISSDSIARPPCPADISNTGYGVDFTYLKIVSQYSDQMSYHLVYITVHRYMTFISVPFSQVLLNLIFVSTSIRTEGVLTLLKIRVKRQDF